MNKIHFAPEFIERINKAENGKFIEIGNFGRYFRLE